MVQAIAGPAAPASAIKRPRWQVRVCGPLPKAINRVAAASLLGRSRQWQNDSPLRLILSPSWYIMPDDAFRRRSLEVLQKGRSRMALVDQRHARSTRSNDSGLGKTRLDWIQPIFSLTREADSRRLHWTE